jgi:hypothetical protein
MDPMPVASFRKRQRLHAHAPRSCTSESGCPIQGADTPVPVPVPDLPGDGDSDGTFVPDLSGAGTVTLPRPRPRFVRNRGRSPVPVPDLLKSGTRLPVGCCEYPYL